MIAPVAIVRRSPRHDRGTTRRTRTPPATSAAAPATLSCQPRSSTVRGTTSGAARAEREDRPRRRRPLAQPARRAARRASRRRARPEAARRSPRRRRGAAASDADARRRARQPQRGAEQLERERDDPDVQPRHAEHVHQPRVGVAVALRRVDRAHVRDDERADERRVRREDAIDARARPSAQPRQERIALRVSGPCPAARRSRVRRPAPGPRARSSAPGAPRPDSTNTVARRRQPSAEIQPRATSPSATVRSTTSSHWRRAASAVAAGPLARARRRWPRATPPVAMAVTPPIQPRRSRSVTTEAAASIAADDERVALAQREAGDEACGVRERAPRDERHRADIARARRLASSLAGRAGAKRRRAARLAGHRQRLALANDRAGERRAGGAGELDGAVRADHRSRRPARARS